MSDRLTVHIADAEIKRTTDIEKARSSSPGYNSLGHLSLSLKFSVSRRLFLFSEICGSYAEIGSVHDNYLRKCILIEGQRWEWKIMEHSHILLKSCEIKSRNGSSFTLCIMFSLTYICINNIFYTKCSYNFNTLTK